MTAPRRPAPRLAPMAMPSRMKLQAPKTAGAMTRNAMAAAGRAAAVFGSGGEAGSGAVRSGRHGGAGGAAGAAARTAAAARPAARR